MFIGKNICVVAAGVVLATCTIASLDKKVSVVNKVKLMGLASGLAYIVYSL